MNRSWITVLVVSNPSFGDGPKLQSRTDKVEARLNSPVVMKYFETVLLGYALYGFCSRVYIFQQRTHIHFLIGLQVWNLSFPQPSFWSQFLLVKKLLKYVAKNCFCFVFIV